MSTNKFRILIYNGDTDPAINAFQAQEWTRNLKFEETKAWRPWTLDGCQKIGGYVTRYALAWLGLARLSIVCHLSVIIILDIFFVFSSRYANNFDYLTIRGSGRSVPRDRPQVWKYSPVLTSIIVFYFLTLFFASLCNSLHTWIDSSSYVYICLCMKVSIFTWKWCINVVKIWVYLLGSLPSKH